MKITWIGHSCFKIESFGASVVIDPYGDGTVPGLSPVREEANRVLSTHDHFDHNAVQNVTVTDCEDFHLKIKEIKTFHDASNGSERGNNSIFIISDADYKVAHFGDLGCKLTPDQIEELKGVDVALIPVGGTYTIDSSEACELVKSIEPNAVIPMHFKKENFGFDVLTGVEDFSSHFENVVKADRSFLDTDNISGFRPLIYILEPQNAQ